MCELLRGAGVVYDGGMDTLEDIYAAMMREPDEARCAKPDEGGAGDTLEVLYGQRMAEHEAVRAANPYGCNQYGEGWKMPHNGMSRVRKDDLPKKKEKKKFFEPTEVKAQAGRNTASLVGGDKKKVSWGNNISVEHINQFNEVIAEMQEKYPLTVEVYKMGSYTSRKDSEGAHCTYMYNDDFTDVRIALQINQDHKYGGVHDFEGWRPYGESKAARTVFKRHNVGVTEKGIDVRSVMIHEYGHALSARAYIASEYKGRGAFRNNKNTEQVMQYVDAWRQWKYAYERAINSKDIQKISEYAKKNPQEFFAECFTARELGEKLPDYINSGLDNVIKTANKKP